MIHKFMQGGKYILIDVNSGGVHLIDKLVYSILDYYPHKKEEEIISLLSPEYGADVVKVAIAEIRELEENGLLNQEDNYLQHESFKNKKPVVKALCLHVSHDCNIRCKYCFASQGDFKGQRTLMDSEIGKKAIDFLLTNSGNRRNLEVDFFGGEPLLNFQMVKDIVDYGREREKEYGKNLRFTMTTNGVLLDEEKMDYINKNMHNVVLSIDGREDVNDKMRYTINGKGTYGTILPKLMAMAEMRKHEGYYVRGTFTSFNLDFSKDVLHLADVGFKNISVEPVVAEAHHDYAIKEEDLPMVFKHYEELAEEYVARKKDGRGFNFFHFMIDLNQGPCVIKRIVGCGAGAEYIAVTPEGDLYPCHQFVGNEDFRIGRVVDGSFNKDIYHSFSEAHVYNKEKCNSCWAKFYCSGGCHANAYNFNNDIMVPYDIGCEMEKKRVECALYIQARLMEEED